MIGFGIWHQFSRLQFLATLLVSVPDGKSWNTRLFGRKMGAGRCSSRNIFLPPDFPALSLEQKWSRPRYRLSLDFRQPSIGLKARLLHTAKMLRYLIFGISSRWRCRDEAARVKAVGNDHVTEVGRSTKLQIPTWCLLFWISGACGGMRRHLSRGGWIELVNAIEGLAFFAGAFLSLKK
jgi:hypothetical protein